MKKLKYRVWDYNTHRMLYTDWARRQHWYDKPTGGSVQYDRMSQGGTEILSLPMEYVTCLHDVEAYTGDIVKWSGNYKIRVQTGKRVPCKSFEVGVIHYSKWKLQYTVSVHKQQESNYSGVVPYYNTLQFFDWKVIGNVYAHPCLLNTNGG